MTAARHEMGRSDNAPRDCVCVPHVAGAKALWAKNIGGGEEDKTDHGAGRSRRCAAGHEQRLVGGDGKTKVDERGDGHELAFLIERAGEETLGVLLCQREREAWIRVRRRG
jgi:hypothetical protein